MAGGNIMKLKKHPIYKAIFDRFKRQANKGINKYGALVQSEKLRPIDWAQHAAEEITDQLVYLQCLIESEHAREKYIIELERALDYYAQKENYMPQDPFECTVVHDEGATARKALGYAEED